MSDTHSEGEGSENVTTEMMFIAEKIQVFPESLEKSQVSAMKKKKTAALTDIVKEYVTLFGKEMDIKAFMKKENNMKTRLKKKTDKNKTGNKAIRVPGALAIGVPTQASLPTSSDDIIMESDAHQMTVSGVKANKKPSYILVEEVVPKKLPSQPTSVCGKSEESDETRRLTTTQLQRLVLVEQLEVARLQQQYFSAKLQKLDDTSNKKPSKGRVVVGDKTYYNL